jgi:serine/threonine protein kinase
MNARNTTTCDQHRIEPFLDGTLPPAEEAAFEAHLATCSTCRAWLDAAAADQQSWSDASDQLRDDDWDLAAGDRLSANDTEATVADASAGDSVRQIAHWFSPTDDPRMLGRFGEYEIAGIVGCGGMGVVLKGFDKALNRYAAIKVLAPHLATSAAARRRFSREAVAAAAVVHDNVIAIHGVSEWNGLPYLVMPYVRGVSLQKRLDREGPLSVQEVLRIGMQTAAGLAAAHAQGLVHRDVKPANIMLEPGVERVKLTDFGLARAADDASLTRSGVIAGTPQYMSPEQARGDETDGRSDLFSLGSVLYTMCTGRPPFRAETSYGVLRRITDDEPRPIRELAPEIPEWLVAMIARLHAKRPEDRYQSAEEVAELLEECLAHVQQPGQVALPASLSASTTPARGYRCPGWRVGISLMMLVSILALSAGLFVWERATQSRNPADTGASSGAAKPGLNGARSSTAPSWNDGADDDLRDVGERLEQLEAESRGFWSDVPDQSGLSTEPDRPAIREHTSTPPSPEETDP